MELSQLIGRRIAVLFRLEDRRYVFRGTGRSSIDHRGLGVVRIELDDVGEADGHPVLVLHEGAWLADVVPDTEYGCDYQIEFSGGSDRWHDTAAAE